MSALAAEQPPGATADARSLRLLLAEDEPIQRKKFQRLLQQHGYSVDAVDSGAAALERVLRGEVDILLTDWDMPEMDGAEVCRRIRAASLDRYVYILMITAHTEEADMIAALRAGANDYICKPLSSAALTARLGVACELMQMTRSLAAAKDENARLARFDPAVGCYNKMYLNEKLPAEIARASRHEGDVSLVVMDVDHFKNINDTRGHMTGDEVLRALVKRSTEVLRAEDWMARFGGEEFLVVLPAIASDQAVVVAEKLRLACERTPFETSTGCINVTVSLGVSSYRDMSVHGVAPAADALINTADKALYQSKNAGRNRVTVCRCTTEQQFAQSGRSAP